MLEVFAQLKDLQDLLHLLFIVMVLDFIVIQVKSKVRKKGLPGISHLELWKKISNFVLILLCSIVDTVLQGNGIIFEAKISRLFLYLVLFTECKGILDKLEYTEVTSLFRKVIQNLLDLVKIKINENTKNK